MCFNSSKHNVEKWPVLTPQDLSSMFRVQDLSSMFGHAWKDKPISY